MQEVIELGRIGTAGCLLLTVLTASCQSDTQALELTGVTPNQVPTSRATTVTLEGKGFNAFASIDLNGNKPATIENSWTVQLDDIPLTPNGVVSAGTLEVEVPANLTPGSYDVYVSSPSGADSLLPDGLTVVDGDVPPLVPYMNLFFDNVGINEDLLNFPVLVTLTPANFNYDLAQPMGADIRFIDDDDTTLLPHQIEEWNEGGTSQVWVGVPQIDANSPTDHIHLQYGDPMAATGEDPAAVWTGFHAVYHLNETGSGSTGEFKDSSSPTHHARGGNGAPTQVPVPDSGQIGQGQRFDGNGDQIVVDPSDTFIFPTNAVTLEYWASYSSLGNTMIALSKGSALEGYRSGIDGTGVVGWFVNGVLLFSQALPVTDVFHYVVLTWTGNQMQIYVDGVPDLGVLNVGTFVNTNDPFYIGRDVTASHFYGIIDEVRVRDSALSAAWIQAQYRSMQNNYIRFEEGT